MKVPSCSCSSPCKHWELLDTTTPDNLGCTECQICCIMVSPSCDGISSEENCSIGQILSVSVKVSVTQESPQWKAEERRQGLRSNLCSHRLQNVTEFTVFALYSGCSEMGFPALTSRHSSRWRHKVQKSQVLISGWPQDQLCLLQLRFYSLINLSNVYSLKMSFPSESFL